MSLLSHIARVHRSCGALRLLIPAMLVLFTITPAFAQGGSRTIMRGNPDGSHEVLLLTAPDYSNLRTPDFTARDLPLMKRKLILSQEQASVVNRLIENYIESFRALTKDLAAATSPEAEYIASTQSPTSMPRAEPSDGPMEMNLDGIDVPANANVGIGIGISTSTSDDPNVPAPPPEVKVSVTLDDPEGEEIPQETIDKIRERANRVAASMVEHLIAEEAAKQAGELPKKPIIEAQDDFETLKAEQDALMLTVNEFLKAKARLRAQFVLDAQAALAQEQSVRWPSLERALYRERNLSNGQLPAESVDLMKIIEDLGISEEQLNSIVEEIEAFEMALDVAMRQRDALLATATQKIDEAIANRTPDLALSLTDRVTSLRLAVRNVNQSHIDLFATVLGDQGESFHRAALKSCYPNVYIKTRGKTMFAAVEAMSDLDERVRRDVAGLEAAYEAELAAINEQLRATTDRERVKAARRGIEQLKAGMEGTQSSASDHDDPVRALIIRRAELDDRYLTLVAPLIGTELAAALPKIRKNRDPIRIESGAAE